MKRRRFLRLLRDIAAVSLAGSPGSSQTPTRRPARTKLLDKPFASIVYVDPMVSESGDGSKEAPFKYLSDIQFASNRHVVFKSRVPIRCGSSLTTLSRTRHNLAKEIDFDEVSFSGDGFGEVIISGAVLFTGSEGWITLNGLACRTFDANETILTGWFPRIEVSGEWKATYPCICAPTSDDSVDSFQTCQTEFD